MQFQSATIQDPRQALRRVQRVLQEHVRRREFIGDGRVVGFSPELREPAADDGLVGVPLMPLLEHTDPLDGIDWPAKAKDLDAHGWAVLPRLIPPGNCREVAGWYGVDGMFRSCVKMARHGFGRGEYKYFSYPLPGLVQELRTTLYPYLASIANVWHERLGLEARFPGVHAKFLERCHQAGQNNPTPLLLQYGAGDFNCLHQDLYGEHVFPLQAAVLLSSPGSDFEGGEFVLTEQRPRMQSRVEVVPLAQGDAVVFAVNDRPLRGTRGSYRVKLRHGVSTLRSGHRHTLGIIFHDAK